MLGRELRENSATHGDSFQATASAEVHLLQAVRTLQAQGFEGAATGNQTAKRCRWLHKRLEGCTEIHRSE